LEAIAGCCVSVSGENVDLMLQWADTFNRRDWDAFLAFVDDEVVVESRLVAMEGGYHGHEGVRRWWDDFLGAFRDYTTEIEDLRDLGDVTLGHVRGSGHGAGSATPLIDPLWLPVRWRAGTAFWWAPLARPRKRRSKRLAWATSPARQRQSLGSASEVSQSARSHDPASIRAAPPAESQSVDEVADDPAIAGS
jgi:hypothetical protein